MTENKIEPKADAQGDKLDAIMSILGKAMTRLDEMEKNLPAAPLVTAADKKAKKDDDSKHRKDDDEEEEEEAKKDDDESEAKAKKFMMRKAKKDAEHSNPKEHNEGEIKPDDEGEVEHPGHMEFKKDDDEMCDDDEEEAAKKDDEEAAMCDAQAKADSVYSAFGKSASRPLQGESLTAYRKRMVRGLQAHSDEMKSVNINSIKDDTMLAIVEKRVYADALAASRGTGAIAKGQLIELHKKDRAGRTITEFRGDMEAWLGDFKLPTHRVMKFNTENTKR
jgi:broad specificity phosphatase PhoE